MKRAGPTAGHDFGDNRVPGAGQRVRECLTDRPDLDNQVSLIMTHRDRAGDASGQGAGRREGAGPAGHRQGFPTPPRAPAAGSPARPGRRLPKAFVGPNAFRRGAWLPMSLIATPRACSPKALGSRLYGSLSTRFGISCVLDRDDQALAQRREGGVEEIGLGGVRRIQEARHQRGLGAHAPG